MSKLLIGDDTRSSGNRRLSMLVLAWLVVSKAVGLSRWSERNGKSRRHLGPWAILKQGSRATLYRYYCACVNNLKNSALLQGDGRKRTNVLDAGDTVDQKQPCSLLFALTVV